MLFNVDNGVDDLHLQLSRAIMNMENLDTSAEKVHGCIDSAVYI